MSNISRSHTTNKPDSELKAVRKAKLEKFIDCLTEAEHEEFLAHLISARRVPVSTHLLAKSRKHLLDWESQDSAPTKSKPSYSSVLGKPRLVGVETNPGPTPKRVVKKTDKIVKVIKTKRPQRQLPKIRTVERAATGKLNNYIKALTNPWYAPPVRLGWGTFVPTTLRASWLRYTLTPGALQTAFCISATPTIGAGAGMTSFSENFISTVGTNTLAASTIASSGSYNNGVLAAVAQTGRVVSGALRVCVRYPATALRGNLVGGFLADDSGTNFRAVTFDNLSSQFQSRTVSSSTAGELVVEVQYRPSDLTSFDMNGTLMNTGGASLATILPRCYVVGTGWSPSTFSIEINQIFHYETLAGLDAGGEDEEDGNSLAAAGHTMDEAGQASAKAGQPVITSGLLIDAIDSAISTIAGSRMGRGTRSRGKLAFEPSVSSPQTIGMMNADEPLDPRSREQTPRYVLVNRA